MSKPAELYACLYAREFPAQAMLRLRAELRNRPCVILEGEPPLQHVCSCNSKAHLLGVGLGMTRVELDTFPSVAVLVRSHPEEATAKAAMLECAGTFSPSIEDVSDGIAFLCVMDISGTEKLHGPPITLGNALLDRAGALGITSTVAIASNFHTVICLARGMWSKKRLTVISAGEESAALAPLPLRVLDLSEDQAETFSLWGIHTLGMLAGLPEKPLIARMGQAGRRLRQLAWGALPHLFVPMEPAFALEEFIELDSPVELLDSLLFVVGVMLDQLIVRATGRVLALASVTITLYLEGGGGSHSRTVRPALPTNDRQVWIKLIHLDLEAHPPNAAILSLRLSAEPGRTSKVQLGLFSPQLPDATRFDVTLARIRAIVGEESVGSPILKDAHRPDNFQMKPFVVPTGPSKSIPNRSLTAMRQLRPAEDVSVTLRDRRPASLFFRQTRYDVERAYGPWLAGGEWWGNARWGLQQWDLIARSRERTLLCGCLVRDPTRNLWQMVALYD
jgi:protein ImuB